MPAPPSLDIEATNWLLNEGYKSRALSLFPKPKKKKKEEYKICDFVDTTKAVDGTSGSEEEDFFSKAKSKAARDELESEIPTGNPDGPGRKKKKIKLKTPKKGMEKDQEEDDDQINSCAKKAKFRPQ